MNLYTLYFGFDKFAHDCFRMKYSRDFSTLKLNDAKSVYENWKPLTKKQKKEIATYWGIRCPHKTDFLTHEIMLNVKGDYDIRYCPERIFRQYIDPTLSDRQLLRAWDDKNYFERHQPSLPFPHTYVRNINGYFLDHEYNPINRDAAKKLIVEHLPVIIKPSMASGEGKNLKRISTEKEADKIFTQYEKDYLVQELIVQCDELKNMSLGGVNSFRIITALVNGEPKLLTGHLLGNTTDSVAVNAEAPHGEGVVIIKTDRDGTLSDTGYMGTTLKSLQMLPSGFVFDNLRIPGYEDAVKLTLEAHKSMPMLGVIGWDVTIDKNNKPVFIEWNLRGIEIIYSQLTNGPLFGQYSDYFAEISRKLISKK